MGNFGAIRIRAHSAALKSPFAGSHPRNSIRPGMVSRSYPATQKCQKARKHPPAGACARERKSCRTIHRQSMPSGQRVVLPSQRASGVPAGQRSPLQRAPRPSQNCRSMAMGRAPHQRPVPELLGLPARLHAGLSAQIGEAKRPGGRVRRIAAPHPSGEICRAEHGRLVALWSTPDSRFRATSSHRPNSPSLRAMVRRHCSGERFQSLGHYGHGRPERVVNPERVPRMREQPGVRGKPETRAHQLASVAIPMAAEYPFSLPLRAWRPAGP